ncbi:MAG: EamA family transporter [Lachnospiraceae bacterium]|jgi:small multidrug resistance pump|nr:EamA family transporter [Lachnospiraceae bacterium]
MSGLTACILTMICSETIASFSQIILKKSTFQKYPDWIHEYLNKYVITGYLMLFCSMLLTIRAYGFADAYMNVPVLETMGYVFVMVLGRIFFGEKITRNKLIGMGFIFAGILAYYL